MPEPKSISFHHEPAFGHLINGRVTPIRGRDLVSESTVFEVSKYFAYVHVVAFLYSFTPILSCLFYLALWLVWFPILWTPPQFIDLGDGYHRDLRVADFYLIGISIYVLYQSIRHRTPPSLEALSVAYA